MLKTKCGQNSIATIKRTTNFLSHVKIDNDKRGFIST